MPVLDASFLIGISHRDQRCLALMRRLQDEGRPCRIPAAAWMEFLAGVTPAQRRPVGTFLSEAGSFVPLDRPLAEAAADLQHGFLRQGTRRGWNDLQVAATALILGEPIVSLDGGFDGIAGVEVVRP